MWNQTVAHGTAPNYSKRCRTAQFLKGFSRSKSFQDGRAGCRVRVLTSSLDTQECEIVNHSLDLNSSHILPAVPPILLASLPILVPVPSATIETMPSPPPVSGNNKKQLTARSIDTMTATRTTVGTVGTIVPSRCRLYRRSQSLYRLLSQSGALPLVTPLGMTLFGLDCLDNNSDSDSDTTQL